MIITHFEVLTAAIAAVATSVTAVALGLRWIYRQGVSSQKLVNAVNANTDATGKLTEAYEKFTSKTDGMLFDHEKRITRLESMRHMVP